MAYTEELLEGSLKPLGTAMLTADDLSSAAVHGEYVAMARVKVKRIMAYVSIVTVGASTIEVNRRPLAGSATGEVVVGTIVIPAGTAAGKLVYKDIDPVAINAGEGLSFEVLAAATSGSAHYGFDADHAPQDARENTDMIASA